MKIKKYTITQTEEEGSISIDTVNDGFTKFELLGILTAFKEKEVTATVIEIMQSEKNTTNREK